MLRSAVLVFVQDIVAWLYENIAVWVSGPTKIAREIVEAGERGVIVTVLCDGAYKYLSESFWTDPS